MVPGVEGSSPFTHPTRRWGIGRRSRSLICFSTQGCSQVVRQGTLTPSSAGSSPATPATDDKDGPPSFLYASLAQSAEHLPFKQGVRGSNPRRGTKREPPFGWLSFDACRFLQSKNQSCQRRLLIERAGENRQRCPLHTFLFWRYAGARTTNLWAATKSRLKCASLFAQSGIKNALLRILPEKGRRGA